MTTTTATTVHFSVGDDDQPALRAAWRAVFDHELALHDARSSGVDDWITAASNSLHAALLELDRLEQSTPAVEKQLPTDVYSDVIAHIGRLNMLALRATHVVELDDTLCMGVGRSTDVRLTITRRRESDCRARYDVRVYRVSPAGNTTAVLSVSSATSDDLADAVWDAVDGHL